MGYWVGTRLVRATPLGDLDAKAGSTHIHVPVIVPGPGGLLGPVLQILLTLRPKTEFGFFVRPVTEDNEPEDQDRKR